MLRSLLILLIAGGTALLALPFLMSSLYVDQRGVEIAGHVYSKREDAIVRYSTWYRSCEVTIEYWPKEESRVSFLKVELPPEQYDRLYRGQEVQLHYLRRQDVPEVPFAGTLREIGLLPNARLAQQRAFSGLATAASGVGFPLLGALAGSVLLLIAWRLTRLPGFAWAVAACVFGVLALVLVSEFPMTTPRPSAEVRRAAGKVKSVGRIDRLFSGSRSRGEIAAQPVNVVGVEFVPDGRTEPVLAIDLIDAGSPAVPQGATVTVEYELTRPRTAWVQGVARSFPRRNLTGVAMGASFYVLLLAGVLLGVHYAGRGWKRLLRSST